MEGRLLGGGSLRHGQSSVFCLLPDCLSRQVGERRAQEALILEGHIRVKGIHIEVVTAQVSCVQGGQSQEVVLCDVHAGGEGEGGGAISGLAVSGSHRLPSSRSVCRYGS
jgi:hypothetical protein